MQRLRRTFCYESRPYALDLLLQLTRHFKTVLFALLLALQAASAVGQGPLLIAPPALQDNMDGQTPKLQPLAISSGFSFGQRSIDRKTFRYGSGAERVLLQGPGGQSAQLLYRLPDARVIKELRIVAEVAANRPGAQLAARVVLPRSINQSTGKPFELLVRGGKIGAGGFWEQLTLENLPTQLARHVRVARAKHSQSLDERGAYVSQVVFLAPGGPGTTELLVDRIRVFGLASDQSTEPRRLAAPPTEQPSLTGPSFTKPSTPPRESIKRLTGFPRIIQWQGEPFSLLQKLGFNTISMLKQPSAEQLNKLQILGLSVICPPPNPAELEAHGISAEFDSVLGWNLGEQLSADDLEYVERWEKLVSRYDPIETRPTVLSPQLHTLEASRITDTLLVGRAIVGSQLTIREHAVWLAQRKRLARPGTPLWTKIETQPSLSQQMQMTALSTGGSPVQDATYSQLTGLTAASLSIKPSGFYFESQSSLAAQDEATQQRALALELLNLRLQLTEPWMKPGHELASARSTQPDLTAIVMQAERSHLLVPIWWSLDLQSATHPSTGGPVSFVVPGVAESSEAFLLTLGGLQRLRHQRVTGGIRVSLESLPHDALIMLSNDPRAISQVTQHLRRIAPRATKIRRDLANLRLREVTSLLTQIQQATTETSQAQALLQQARKELIACDSYFGSRSFELAFLRADTADLALDALEKSFVAKHEQGLSPQLAVLHHGQIALPDRLQLQRTLARAPLGANLLVGGGFENLTALLEQGWRHQQLPLEGITTSVRLSPEAPHSGSYCLELQARTLDENAPVTVVPTSPVWISSAPLQVQAGDLLEITGVARLPERLLGTVDGLQIIDSLGGPDLALRIQDAPTWQPFRLIRAVPTDAQVSVTIALSGLGTAQVDDVAIRRIKKSL